MKNPFYFAWGLMVVAWLFTANLRGWSFFHSLSPRHWLGRSSGISHK